MNVRPHFRARVTAKTTEDGGRKSPINWGYRPDLRFEIDDKYYYGVNFVHAEDPDSPALAPGQSTDIDFHIRSGALQIMPRLSAGCRFTMNEGSRAVADGVVTAVYRTDD